MDGWITRLGVKWRVEGRGEIKSWRLFWLFQTMLDTKDLLSARSEHSEM